MFNLICFIIQILGLIWFYTRSEHNIFDGFMIGWCVFFALLALITFVWKSIKRKSIYWFT
jgi:hypothetical protein